MTKARKDSLLIGAVSALALLLHFILPDPVKYKGPAVGLLPLANYFVVVCGVGGIIYAIYLFCKRSRS